MEQAEPKTAYEWEQYLVNALELMIGKGRELLNRGAFPEDFRDLIDSVDTSVKTYRKSRAQFDAALSGILDHLAKSAEAMKEERIRKDVAGIKKERDDEAR